MGTGAKTEKDFNERITARTRIIRGNLNLTQKEMADLLGITLERYKKYEKRTPLPLHLIPNFCAIGRVSIAFFLTGREELASKAAA